MTSPDATRVPLGAEVSAKVYDDLRDVAVDKYGETSGNVGRVAERALEEFLGTDRYGRVEERLDDLLDREDLEVPTGAAKKTEAEARDRDGETTQVGARVRPELKERAKEQAHEWDVPLYDLVTRAFREYVYGGRADRLLDKLDRLEDAIDETVADDELAEDDVDDEPKSTAEKIADRLGDPFTLDEFHDAAEAEGVGTPSYRVETYLPKVLEITGTVPAPTRKRDEFVRESAVSEHPNPAYLPYPAMDDDDKRLAIKAEALRRTANLSDRAAIKFDATDAREALGGRAPPSLIKRLFREIADDVPDDRYGGPEIRYKPDEGVLTVDKRKLKKNSVDHQEALKVAGVIEPDQGTDPGTSEDDDTTEPTTPDATTSSTAPPARADGGDDDADRDELKEEAEERMAELTGAVADA